MDQSSLENNTRLLLQKCKVILQRETVIQQEHKNDLLFVILVTAIRKICTSWSAQWWPFCSMTRDEMGTENNIIASEWLNLWQLHSHIPNVIYEHFIHVEGQSIYSGQTCRACRFPAFLRLAADSCKVSNSLRDLLYGKYFLRCR